MEYQPIPSIWGQLMGAPHMVWLHTIRAQPYILGMQYVGSHKCHGQGQNKKTDAFKVIGMDIIWSHSPTQEMLYMG